MKFSDIDFSAISRMMDNMSDEEKNKLNDMAQNMMNNMKQNEEPEEETDFYEALNINEEDYADFPGSVLDQIPVFRGLHHECLEAILRKS